MLSRDAFRLLRSLLICLIFWKSLRILLLQCHSTAENIACLLRTPETITKPNLVVPLDRPDLDTIIEAAPLLEVENVHADAFLGVGSLVQAYCRDHPKCNEAPPVLRVMDTLQGFIKNSCRRETSREKIQVCAGRR